MYTVFNQAKGRLDSAITQSDTTITLDDSFSPFPDVSSPVYGGDAFWDTSNATTKPSDDFPFYMTLVQYNSQPDTSTMPDDEKTAIESGILKTEIITVSQITNDTLTITNRGYGETVEQAYSAGSWVYGFIIKQHVDILQKLILMNLSVKDFTSYFS